MSWGPTHRWPIDGPKKPSGAPIVEHRPKYPVRLTTRETIWGAGLRWSFGARAWCGFFASLTDGRVLLRYELSWFRVGPDEAAADILARKAALPNLHGGIVANPELWPKEPGDPSDSETFSKAGVILRRGTSDRVNGWARVRWWLTPRKQKSGEIAPSLLIHPDCKHLLRTLPMLVSDPANVDDVQACAEELPAMGVLLYLMARPLPSIEPVVEAPGPGTWGHALQPMWQGGRTSGLRDRYRLG